MESDATLLQIGHRTRPSLLVVDDVPDNIVVLTSVLGGLYQVRVATSGARALAMCAVGMVPDLILLDVLMPDLDGLEVCRRLKADPRTAGVPVILVTGLTDPADETRGFEAGAVDYLTKPISPSVVLKRVQLHLELRAARRRLERLSGHYSAYLPPELSASIRRGEVGEGVGSQRKTLTICMSDIKGFTRRTEELGAEEMTILLNAYFKEMTLVVRKYGGTLDKYIGDAMLMFFGDPTSRGVAEDAAACVQMGLEMQERLASVGESWKRFGLGDALAVRVGISTGVCTVGNFGSPDQMAYTVLGTPVNLAARLQSHCPAGRVLVSAPTWNLVRNQYHWDPMPDLHVKGFTDLVQAWMPAAGT